MSFSKPKSNQLMKPEDVDALKLEIEQLKREVNLPRKHVSDVAKEYALPFFVAFLFRIS
jgi:hypothetical protein